MELQSPSPRSRGAPGRRPAVGRPPGLHRQSRAAGPSLRRLAPITAPPAARGKGHWPADSPAVSRRARGSGPHSPRQHGGHRRIAAPAGLRLTGDPAHTAPRPSRRRIVTGSSTAPKPPCATGDPPAIESGRTRRGPTGSKVAIQAGAPARRRAAQQTAHDQWLVGSARRLPEDDERERPAMTAPTQIAATELPFEEEEIKS